MARFYSGKYRGIGRLSKILINLNICLDTIEDLGEFVEIEYLSNNNSKKTSTINR